MKRTMLLLVLLFVIPSCGGDSDGGGGSLGGGTPLPEEWPKDRPPGPRSDPADAIWNDSELNDIHLTMSPSDWNHIINDTRSEAVHRPARFQWKDIVLEDIGVFPGSESPGTQKRTLELQFNVFRDQTFLDLGYLKLDSMWPDQSLMRDRISFWVHRARQVAPRSGHCRVFVNGQYRGLYEVEENMSQEFLLNRWNTELGNLYQMDWSGDDIYRWFGAAVENYIPDTFIPQSNVETADHSRVVELVDAINNRPDDLPWILDMETMLEYLAVEAVILNNHGLNGDVGPDNHWMYLIKEVGRFFVIPTDMDSTWNDDPTRDLFINFERNSLSSLFRNDGTLRQLFKAKVGEVLETVGRLESIQGQLDFIYNQIRDAVHADSLKQFSNDEFDWHYQYMRELYRQRREYLLQAISEP